MLNEPESQNDPKLEAALREAAEWKARALATQNAAESLKEKAHYLKQKAQQAFEQNKELTLALRKATRAAQEYQSRAQRYAEEMKPLAKAAAHAQEQREAAGHRLSAVEQQLELYQAALSELRGGSRLQDVQKIIREALATPQADAELEALRQELEQCRAALEAAESEKDDIREDMWANRMVLENKIKKLEERNRELEDSIDELYRSFEGMISDRALNERELDRRVEDLQLQLSSKTRALERKKDEVRELAESNRVLTERMATVEEDNQHLVEELYTEAETLREEIAILNAEKLEMEDTLRKQISMLEDERSDLEIVNADLVAKIYKLGNSQK